MVTGEFSLNNAECEKNGLGEPVDGGFWSRDVWTLHVYHLYFTVYDLRFEVYTHKTVWEIVHHRELVDEQAQCIIHSL